jgi:hypothetical protein
MSDGVDYEGEPLHRGDLGGNPLAALATWVGEAVEAGERQSYAMALATIDPDGRPAVRFVLLRGVDDLDWCSSPTGSLARHEGSPISKPSRLRCTGRRSTARFAATDRRNR